MNNNAKAMVLASFAADALALGVHGIYNTNVIDKKWGRVEGIYKTGKTDLSSHQGSRRAHTLRGSNPAVTEIHCRQFRL